MANQEWTFRTVSEEGTIAAGMELANRLRGVVLLSGGLGAGKTTLVRGIVAGVEGAQAGEVSSPTFTLIHEYGAGVTHIDLYRLDEPREIESLGLDDIFDNSRLVLIEWGEKMGASLPADRTEISIERPPGGGPETETARVIHVVQRGAG